MHQQVLKSFLLYVSPPLNLDQISQKLQQEMNQVVIKHGYLVKYLSVPTGCICTVLFNT